MQSEQKPLDRRRFLKAVGRYARRPRWIIERLCRTRQIRTSDICWIFGVGRSGSTWLTELLGALRPIRAWHEPYFGAVLNLPTQTPTELEREHSFFSNAYRDAWQKGLRELLQSSARARFGKISKGTKLIIKDINSAQICPYFPAIFPDSQYLLLIREPFDVLDSYIAMSQKDSWGVGQGEVGVERFAEHIRWSLTLSLEGYRKTSDDKRLLVRYEDLLDDPFGELSRCVRFLKIPVSDQEIEASCEAAKFEKHAQKGPQAFRRFGKTGIWQESGNFTPEVLAIATQILGGIRDELGYGTSKNASLTSAG